MRFASTTKSVHLSPSKHKRGSFGLISIASKSERSENKEETIEFVLKAIQDLAKEWNLFDLVFISSKMRGDNYLENREFSKALAVYKFLRIYCRIAQRMEEEMNIADQLGHMLRFTKNHPKAADMFRLVLKYAWICDDQFMELKAYDNLSYEHFQMGNLGKSKYYSQKYTEGLIESNFSKMKSSCVQPYRDTKEYEIYILKISWKYSLNNLQKLIYEICL